MLCGVIMLLQGLRAEHKQSQELLTSFLDCFWGGPNYRLMLKRHRLHTHSEVELRILDWCICDVYNAGTGKLWHGMEAHATRVRLVQLQLCVHFNACVIIITVSSTANPSQHEQTDHLMQDKQGCKVQF